MLQIIRSHMLGVFAKILVGIISLAFAIFGVESYLVSGDRDNNVAKVNGEKITAHDLNIAYNRVRNNALNQYGKDFRLTTEVQEQMRQQALQQLITRDIIYQAAAQQGFRASPYAVEALVQNMPIFQQDGKFSPELFSRILMNLEYTPAGFFKDMAITMTIGQLIDGISNSAFALPNEIEQAYLLAEQKRDFKYLTLSLEKAIANANVTEAEIAAYYKDHTKDFQSEETVSLEYVELLADSIFGNQTATDQEIKEFYNSNPENFSTPARWQVAKMRVPLAENADEKAISAAESRAKEIAEQLKKESTAPSEASVSWVSPDKQQIELVKLLASKKVGDVTEIKRDKDGFTVYKILAKETAKPLPFDEVKDKVQEALLKHKAEQEFLAKSDQLAEIAFTSPDSLQPIANAMKLPIQQSNQFARQGGKEGLSASPKVVSAAFSDAVLQQSTNSEPIEVKSGQIVVVRIKEHHPAKTLPLKDVQEKIVAILKKQKALIAIKTAGEKFVTELKNGKNAQEIAKSQNAQWNEKTLATRQESNLDREIIRLAFSQSAPKNNHTNFTGATLTNGDYAIVSVEKIYSADKNKLTEQERSVYANQIKMDHAARDANYYVKALRDKAKIVMVEKQ